jgi:hypothetical protein
MVRRVELISFINFAGCSWVFVDALMVFSICDILPSRRADQSSALRSAGEAEDDPDGGLQAKDLLGDLSLIGCYGCVSWCQYSLQPGIALIYVFPPLNILLIFMLSRYAALIVKQSYGDKLGFARLL